MRSRINYLQLNVCFWQVRIWPVRTPSEGVGGNVQSREVK